MTSVVVLVSHLDRPTMAKLVKAHTGYDRRAGDYTAVLVDGILLVITPPVPLAATKTDRAAMLTHRVASALKLYGRKTFRGILVVDDGRHGVLRMQLAAQAAGLQASLVFLSLRSPSAHPDNKSNMLDMARAVRSLAEQPTPTAPPLLGVKLVCDQSLNVSPQAWHAVGLSVTVIAFDPTSLDPPDPSVDAHIALLSAEACAGLAGDTPYDIYNLPQDLAQLPDLLAEVVATTRLCSLAETPRAAETFEDFALALERPCPRWLGPGDVRTHIFSSWTAANPYSQRALAAASPDNVVLAWAVEWLRQEEATLANLLPKHQRGRLHEAIKQLERASAQAVYEQPRTNFAAHVGFVAKVAQKSLSGAVVAAKTAAMREADTVVKNLRRLIPQH